MKPKMILTDLDKTLLRSDGDISEYTKKVLKKCQDCGILVVIATARVLWNSHHISESEKLHKAVYCDYSEPLSCQVNKIVAELPDGSIAVKIAERNQCRLQCYRGENWYSFLPENSGKVQAIHALAEILNISLKDVISFGDDLNDMAMLQMCGMGVAVSNAIEEVKNIADDTTLSNDEDGVADWIEKRIFS